MSKPTPLTILSFEANCPKVRLNHETLREEMKSQPMGLETPDKRNVSYFNLFSRVRICQISSH